MTEIGDNFCSDIACTSVGIISINLLQETRLTIGKSFCSDIGCNNAGIIDLNKVTDVGDDFCYDTKHGIGSCLSMSLLRI